MSYISAIKQKEEVIVWERDNNGNRITKRYEVPYYFYIQNEMGEYKDLYGNVLTKVEFDSYFDMKGAKEMFDEKDIQTYEYDIPATLKILSKHYYNAITPKLHMTFYDIEVDYSPEKGMPMPGNSYAPLNAIAIYNMWEHKIYCIGIPPNEKKSSKYDIDDFKKAMEAIEPIEIPYELQIVDTERELLLGFMELIDNSDLLAGWNSRGFDTPYIGERIEHVLGKGYFKQLSFKEGQKPKYGTFEKFGNDNIDLKLSGRITTDYLEIYRKFKIVEQQSYKLESIAEDELPEMRKLEFDGSLYTLYRNDFVKFLRYNIRDTEILHGFEEKLGYMGIANELYHSSTGLFEHVTGTLKTTELSLINYCHYDLDVIVNDNPQTRTEEKIEGAYVLDPKIGMHSWIASVDINSLYPSSIRAINISPETIIGQFRTNKEAFEEIRQNSDMMLTLAFEYATTHHMMDGEMPATLEMKASDWKEQLQRLGWALSGYGTIFRQNNKGMVPAVLENWYATRKKYQKLMREYRTKAQAILNKYEDL